MEYFEGVMVILKIPRMVVETIQIVGEALAILALTWIFLVLMF